jgi:V8-like Glu-specific endopeptidase
MKALGKLLTLIFVFLFAGCGGSMDNRQLQSLTVSPQSVTALNGTAQSPYRSVQYGGRCSAKMGWVSCGMKGVLFFLSLAHN